MRLHFLLRASTICCSAITLAACSTLSPPTEPRAGQAVVVSSHWQDEVPDRHALKVHVYNLRQQIDKPFSQKMVHTLPHKGLF